MGEFFFYFGGSRILFRETYPFFHQYLYYRGISDYPGSDVNVSVLLSTLY